MKQGLLRSHRTLGVVCGDQGFVRHVLGKEPLISVSLGTSFLTYSVNSLRLKFLGPLFEKQINAVGAYKDLILLAVGARVSAWHKVRQLRVYEGSSANILDILVLGDYVIGLNCSEELVVWHAETGELHRTIPVAHAPVCVLHPPTYLNKVIVATERPGLVLINVKTGMKVYDFPGVSAHLNGKVKCIEFSGVLDIVGLGLDNGTILIVNTLSDSVLKTLLQNGAVLSMSFSVCKAIEKLVSTGESGVLNVWDLNKGRLECRVKGHSGFCIEKVLFLPNEPVFVSSSGADNSIKMWVFDDDEAEPRVLKHRKGFHSPPASAVFYDDSNLLALSKDSLYNLSVINEHQSVDFAYSKINKRIRKSAISFNLEGFSALAFSGTRERDWCNVVTCHAGHSSPVLWSYENKVIGNVPVETRESCVVTCVAVSQCGNFGVSGYSNGHIEKFNMQSGLYSAGFIAHTDPVTSLQIDNCNRLLISSTDKGTLKFWDFLTGKAIRTIETHEKVTKLSLDRMSNLIGILQETRVSVADIRTFQLARKFLVDSPTDLSFSHDSRWVGVAYSKFIQIWDLASANIIEWVSFSETVASLSFSPTGEFLATTHENSLGVFLWVNQAYSSNVIIDKAPTRPRKLRGFDVRKGKSFYTRNPLNIEEIITDLQEKRTENPAKIEKFPAEIAHEAARLSGVPYYRVQALYHLDEMKERNRPIEPPKKPEKIPFFLPDSLEIVKPIQEVGGIETEKKKMTEDITEYEDYLNDGFIGHLMRCTPSKIELILLELTDEQTIQCVEILNRAICCQENYEFVQSVVNRFVKIHAEKLSKDQMLTMKNFLRKTWGELEEQYMLAISGLERLK